MTDEELKKYYADLLISQYRSKPKARAHIELLAEMIVSSQIFTEVRDAFSLTESIGVQLDTIGKYQGISRDGFGFDGLFVTLNDDDYRNLLNLAIVLNYSEANLYEIQNLINQNFGNSIVVFDYLNMRMGYIIDASIGSTEMAQLFVAKGLLPKPTGVLLSSVIYTDTPHSYYGFVTYSQPVALNNSPMNTYGDYILTYPWLSGFDILGVSSFISIGNEDDSGIILQEDSSILYF